MKKTDCKRGHEMKPENTYIRPARGHTECMTCKRALRRLNTDSGMLKEHVVRNVLVGLREGKTIYNLGGYRGSKYIGGGIVSLTRLRRFCHKNTELGKRIVVMG